MREEQTADGFELAIGGGLYGLVLCVIGLLAAGWGHGTYLPIAVFGAPFGAIYGPVGLFACLAWWPAVAFALGSARRPMLAATLLLIHAAAVVTMLVFGTPFESATEQWRYYEQARSHFGALLFTGWVVYVVGQAVAWALVLLRWVDGDRAPA